MDGPTYRFLSLRTAVDPDAAGGAAPPNLLVDALEESGTPYRMTVYEIEREHAAHDPDSWDLYPNGPLSGPERVFLYEFETTEPHWVRASAIAESTLHGGGHPVDDV